MLELDHQYPDRQVAGTDEAGRGPLCGPVYAAAVILHPGRPVMALNDSKQLTERRREALFEQIQTEAMAWCIAHCTAAEIDRYNILQASHLAMVRAIEGLCTVPDHVLVDGNRVPKTLTLPAEAVVKGDGRHSAIAAASILAKVARDRCMAALDSQYPGYGLASNKGYPTAAHRLALSRLGATPEHRRSFAPVRMALAERQTDTARAPVTEQGTLEL